MPRGATAKQERQYKHIRDSEKKLGRGDRAEEIAARTVNKERAQSGQTASARTKTKSSGKASTSTSSSSRRGGGGGGGPTYRELYAEAQRRDIKGRSSMDKAQLERALSGKRGR